MTTQNVTTEVMVQAAQRSEPKSTEGVFELPCGWIDQQGNLHTEVEVREITGAEEDMFASDAIPANKKLGELIYRCVKRVGTVTDRGMLSQVIKELPVGDRVFLMFAIRRVTLGPKYPFEDTCPECEKKRLYEVDLAELEVKHMADKTKRIFESTLTNGKQIKFRTLLGIDEEKLQKVSKSSEALSQAMLVRVMEYDNKPIDLQTIKSLNIAIRQEIRDLFDLVDGGVDTTIEMVCPDCGTGFDRDVDIGQPGFFFPGQARKLSKRKSSG